MKGVTFPSTRAESLERLNEFLPAVALYSERRNEVWEGHGNVSRLSPAFRSRVLLEREAIAAVLARHSFSGAEKFVQEICWRLYWKSWLEMRPAVWSQYRDSLGGFSGEAVEKAERIENAESGVTIMNFFARELVETGYLHNHARMWFAALWIHTERIPWQLGADFFLRHLRDADAASNTLSWRWVAGLHTPGKTYLARRSNLERYVDPVILKEHSAGLERLENTEPWTPGEPELENPPPEEPVATALDPSTLPPRWGLWIHDEDLLPERSELGEFDPVSILATHFDKSASGEHKREHLAASLADGLRRAERHFDRKGELVRTADLPGDLYRWVEAENLEAVVSMRPFVGPLMDEIDAVQRSLSDIGCDLRLLRRPEDAATIPLATAGFFGFWKKLGRKGFDFEQPGELSG